MKFFKKNTQTHLEDFAIPEKTFTSVTKEDLKKLPSEVTNLLKEHETYSADLKAVIKSSLLLTVRGRDQVQRAQDKAREDRERTRRDERQAA